MIYMRTFYPEGGLIDTPDNQARIRSATALCEAASEQTVIEAKVVLCDAAHNLHVDLPAMKGIVPYEEGAIGIIEGTVRDIALISRVGKPIAAVVTGFEHTPTGERRAVFSRRRAQEMCRDAYIDRLQVGDVIPARVTRLETFGAFCDIGCGLPALMPIASISVSRISHPRDRLYPGMEIRAVVSSKENGRICLSQRELLGTWEENAALFAAGETVTGIVRSVEDYGVFIELTPNLAGLAEPKEGATVGGAVTVYIKSILPDKMKLKLIIIDFQEDAPRPPIPHYFTDATHLSHWVYSPDGCPKRIESLFDALP